MMDVTLRIKIDEFQPKRVAAWYVEVHSVAGLVAELTRWRVPQRSLRIHLIPHAGTNRQPLGALIVSDQASHKPSPVCLAYQCLGNNLYLPANATLVPAAREEELTTLLEDPEKVYVFHPTVGLVQFARRDVLELSDLITLPGATDTRWDLAQAGTHFNERLYSIEAVEPPPREPHQDPVEAIFQRQEEGIGEQSPALDSQASRERTKRPADKASFPEADQHPKDSSAAGAGAPGAAGAWLTKLPGLVNKWLAKVIQVLTTPIGSGAVPRQVRSAEAIDWLLEKFMREPDEALKYSPPLESGDSRDASPEPIRGLGRHDLHYDPAEAVPPTAAGPSYEVSAEQFYQLQKAYRDAANRELRLGRYRRAAYIFAKLLGDPLAAAAALRDGRHFRDAALLYERHNQLRDAADCFHKAAMYDRALQLYEQLQAFRMCAEIHEFMGHSYQARLAYQRELDKQLSHRRYDTAAALAYEKLADRDEAIRLLVIGWRVGSHRATCLAALMQHLTELDDEDVTTQTLAEILQPCAEIEQATLAAPVLAHAAKTHPRPAIRALLRRATRRLVAEHVDAAPTLVASLLQGVASLDTSDALLADDCRRFAANCQARFVQRFPRRTKVTCLRVVHPDVVFEVDAAMILGDHIHMAGVRPDQSLILATVSPTGVVELAAGESGTVRYRPVQLAWHARASGEWLLYHDGSPSIARWRDHPVRTAWWNDPVVAVTGGHDTVWWIEHSADLLVLKNTLGHTTPLADALQATTTAARPHIASSSTAVFVAQEQRVVAVTANGTSNCAFRKPVVDIAYLPLLRRIAVMLPEHIVIFDEQMHYRGKLLSELQAPRITSIGNDVVVVVDTERIQVFQGVSDSYAQLLDASRVHAGEPVAVLNDDLPMRFHIVSRDGAVETMTLAPNLKLKHDIR